MSKTTPSDICALCYHPKSDAKSCSRHDCLLSGVTGSNLCQSCDKCEGTPDPHSCPYQSEINDDDSEDPK